jgi:hypothetical protein
MLKFIVQVFWLITCLAICDKIFADQAYVCAESTCKWVEVNAGAHENLMGYYLQHPTQNRCSSDYVYCR